MAIKIGVYVGRILLNPFIHNAKVALRIRAKILCVARSSSGVVGSLVNSDLSLIPSALEVSAAILANHAKDALLKCSPKPAVAVLPHPLIFYQPLTIFECVRPLLLAFGPVGKGISQAAPRIDIRDGRRRKDFRRKRNPAGKFERRGNRNLRWYDGHAGLTSRGIAGYGAGGDKASLPL